MDPLRLEPNHWYYLRKRDGTLVPYRLHRVLFSDHEGDESKSTAEVEMYVGSMLARFPASAVVAPAEMPKSN